MNRETNKPFGDIVKHLWRGGERHTYTMHDGEI